MAKMNEALIKVKKESGIKSNEIISEATGIDTSTMSLHFSGKRKINFDQAYLYAKFFKVHVLKIIDNNITQYPLVAYCDSKGLVRLRNEDEWEVVIAPNDTENDGNCCIYQKNAKTILWYNPKIKLEKKILGERFIMFLDICRYNHSKPTTKISAYVHDPAGTFKQRMDENPYYSYKEYYMDIDLPDNCNYYRDNKGIIPIIKIRT